MRSEYMKHFWDRRWAQARHLRQLLEPYVTSDETSVRDAIAAAKQAGDFAVVRAVAELSPKADWVRRIFGGRKRYGYDVSFLDSGTSLIHADSWSLNCLRQAAQRARLPRFLVRL